MALVREGSEAAGEEIVRRYRAALVRYAATIVPGDRADDVIQDSLAKALPRLAEGDAEIHLRPWLYTIVRNTALNELRDAPPPHEQIDESHDGVEQPPQALERRQSVRRLVAGMRSLPAAQRQALVKRELEGRSHEEISAELGVSTGAARQLIFRARESLRQALGSLLPMPLLRSLAEGGGGDGTVAAAAAGGGGAVAIKAAVAIVATGAVVAGGVAVKQVERRERPVPTVAKQLRAVPQAREGGPGIGHAANKPSVSRETRARRTSGEDSRRGGGDHSSGHGPGPSSEGSGGSDSGSSNHRQEDESGHPGGRQSRGSKHGDEPAENHGSGSISGSSGSSSGHGGPSRETSGSSGGPGPSGESASGGSGSSGDSGPSGSSVSSGPGGPPAESDPEAISEPPRDPGGGDGLSGETDQQPEEDG